MGVTIVSCYYPFPDHKKNSLKEYFSWIENFLRECDSPIVMFSEGIIADELDSFRRSISPIHAANWRIIRRPFSELGYDWKGFWESCHSIDSAREIRTPDIYRLWANKTLFLEEIAHSNPFSTSHFLWCDAGCWRDKAFAEKYARGWPDKLPYPLQITWMDKLAELEASANTILHKSLTIDEFCKKIHTNDMTVAGAIFGGSWISVLRFSITVKNVLEAYRRNDIFPETDQSVMATASLWMQHLYGKPSVKHWDTLSQSEGNRWFFLQSQFTAPTANPDACHFQ